MKPIILASQSPRRKDLLTMMGIDFDAVPSKFEEYLDDSRTPEEIATELALGKAMAVAKLYPDCLVIGSDTIATVQGRQLEKPVDTADALRLLKLLAGKPNDVATGVAVVRLRDGVILTGVETTRVFFRPFNERLVEEYIATGDPMDKAGAYGIQSGAAPLISYIEGSYDTVVGLPTELLASLLQKIGIKAKAVVLESPVEQRARILDRADKLI